MSANEAWERIAALAAEVGWTRDESGWFHARS